MGRDKVGCNNLAEAIKEAMVGLGGERSIEEVKQWIKAHYGNRWQDITTTIAYLTYPGNKSSSYAPSERFLIRVSRGVYRLKD